MGKPKNRPISRKAQQERVSALISANEFLSRDKAHLITQVQGWHARAAKAETERDQLKVALEIEKEARRRWQANLTAVSQRNARLQRQRELLLDVMTSAEDAGADFSSIAHATNPVDLTDEMQKRDTRFFNDDGGKRTA